MTQVARLTIRQFRGIASELELGFRDISGQISSVLLAGDNGSGKSSIVDALEFALQGRINRNQAVGSLSNVAAVSFTSKTGAHVRVELADGTAIERPIAV